MNSKLSLSNTEADQNNLKPVCLLVAGMHRGGTSACTRVINLMGAKLPGNLMAAHQDFNPKGFWESNDVVELNEVLLSAAKTSWQDPLEIDFSIISSETRATFKSKLQQFLSANQFSREPFVLKDPRISRLLPLWISALSELGYPVKIIIPVRNPADVAASLKNRDNYSSETSAYLWLRYMLDSIRFAKGLNFCLLHFDDLLLDWRNSINKVSLDLAITWPITPDSVARDVDEFLDLSLRHHQARDHAQTENGFFMTLANQFYNELCQPEISQDISKIQSLANLTAIELASIEHNILPVLRDYASDRYQLQSNLALSQKETTASKLKQQEAYQNVRNLENALLEERTIFQNLRTEFDLKCKHVDALSAEISHLQSYQAELQKELNDQLNLEKTTEPKRLTDEVGAAELNIKLEQIIDLIKNRNHQVKEKKEIEMKKDMQFNEAMTRADAQLDLLKHLFSINK